MSLSDLFTSKTNRLLEAVDNNDLATAEKLMAKEISFVLFTICQAEHFRKISKEMVQLFLDKIDNPVYQRWTSKYISRTDAKKDLPVQLLYASLRSGRYDLAEMLLARDAPYNHGKAEYHVAGAVIESDAPAADKLRWLKKTLSSGFDKIEDRDQLPLKAVLHDFPEAVGLFAAIGFDLHKDNEYLLAAAVKERKAGMCHYLVTAQGSDAEAILRPARELGRKEDEQFLLGALKGYTSPAPAAPDKTVTDKALADEVVALRQLVRELTEKVENLQSPGSTLDKPGPKLPKP